MKPDNWIIRSHPEIVSDLMLVDFGRAKDLATIISNDCNAGGLHGSVAAEDLECVAMRTRQKWCYDFDCYGVCVCAHTLLFGAYMEIERVGNRFTLKKPMRRYWQTPLWRLLFDSCLNMIGPNTNLDVYTKEIRGLKIAFEAQLRGRRRELTSFLVAQSEMLPSKKEYV